MTSNTDTKQWWEKSKAVKFGIPLLLAAGVTGYFLNGGNPDTQSTIQVKGADGKPMSLTQQKSDDVTTGYSLNVAGAPSPVVGLDSHDVPLCGIARSFPDLVACKGNDQTYIDSVNRLSWLIGYNWDDVLRWANQCGTKPAGAILISELPNVTPGQAQADLAGVLDDQGQHVWPDAYNTPVLPPQSGIINTKDRDVMNTFFDPSHQIRMSLVKMDANCNPDPSSVGGIFEDCYNGWGQSIVIPSVPEAPAPAPAPPAAPPPEAPPEGPPPAPPEAPPALAPPIPAIPAIPAIQFTPQYPSYIPPQGPPLGGPPLSPPGGCEGGNQGGGHGHDCGGGGCQYGGGHGGGDCGGGGCQNGSHSPDCGGGGCTQGNNCGGGCAINSAGNNEKCGDFHTDPGTPAKGDPGAAAPPKVPSNPAGDQPAGTAPLTGNGSGSGSGIGSPSGPTGVLSQGASPVTDPNANRGAAPVISQGSGPAPAVAQAPAAAAPDPVDTQAPAASSGSGLGGGSRLSGGSQGGYGGSRSSLGGGSMGSCTSPYCMGLGSGGMGGMGSGGYGGNSGRSSGGMGGGGRTGRG